MASFAGKYTFDKAENFDGYLKGLGLDEEKIKGVVAANSQLEIKVNGNEYTLVSGLGSRTFPLDKETDEKLGETVLKSTASVSGNKLTVKSVGPDGKKGERVYELSDSGIVLTMSSEGAGSAKLYLKKA